MNALFKSFYKRMFFSIGGSILLGVSLFYLPINASMRREAKSAFENAMTVKAIEVEFILSTFILSAKSLGSRTAIRQKLQEYHAGSVDIGELRNFTAPKFSDGAAVLGNLLAAGRFLPDGKSVSFWGDERLLKKHLQDRPELYRIREGGNTYFMVISRLGDSEKYYGYDACLFDASMILRNDSTVMAGYEILDDFPSNGVEDELYRTVRTGGAAFVLAGTIKKRVIFNASVRSLMIVALYSLSLLVFISLLSYFMLFKFMHTLIGDHIDLNNRLNNALERRDLLLKEVHHRIKNNLNAVFSLLTLQSGSSANPTIREALDDAASRVHSMGLLHDRLYGSVNFTDVSVKDYLSDLIDQAMAYFPIGGAVRCEKHIDDFILDAKRLQPIGIIINELLTNIVKYAFTGRTEGTVTVSATLAGGRISIRIQDDGNGIPESIDFSHSGGFGLELIGSLVKQINGNISIVRKGGTAVLLEFSQ
ncbi:MAG TPA: hypothetical protein DIC34_12980 [Treponema sp.]|nr:MAG: hypothetical protein A2001_16495 [Treponema sp. GWC1_61_84]OHE76593.1 MAG: hypothetical protein A2413_18545 [Treponema sp. RIFOXYC1_FULL_61_9]HCM27437.1 hypothetical protein [Treponema sp.]